MGLPPPTSSSSSPPTQDANHGLSLAFRGALGPCPLYPTRERRPHFVEIGSVLSADLLPVEEPSVRHHVVALREFVGDDVNALRASSPVSGVTSVAPATTHLEQHLCFMTRMLLFAPHGLHDRGSNVLVTTQSLMGCQ